MILSLLMITFSTLLIIFILSSVFVIAAMKTVRQYHSICMVFVIVFFIFHSIYQNHLADDAFISFRYSKNLANGVGLVWNPNYRVEGYTNFLWVVILAGLRRLGFDIVNSARYLGLVFASLSIVITYLIGSKIHSRNQALLASALVATNGAFAIWAFSGMETALFTALILYGAYCFIAKEKNRFNFWLSPIIFALSSLVRPEGIIFFSATLFWIFYKSSRNRKTIGDASRYLLLFCVIFVPYYIWRYNYYGYLLPNTFYAKTGGGFYQYLRGLIYIKSYISLYGGIIVVVPVILVLLKKTLEDSLKYMLFLTSIILLYTAWVGGDGLPSFRFVVPMVPFISIFITEGLYVAYDILHRILSSSPIIGQEKLLNLGVVVILLVLAVNIRAESDKYERNSSIDDRIAIGMWLKYNAQVNASIAVAAAGAIPYYSELYTIDVLGLNDIHIAHMKVENMGTGKAGHEKYDGLYVLSKKPTYITLDSNRLSSTPIENKSNDRIEMILNPGKRGSPIWDNPEFHNNYRPRSILINGRYFNFFEKESGI